MKLFVLASAVATVSGRSLVKPAAKQVLATEKNTAEKREQCIAKAKKRAFIQKKTAPGFGEEKDVKGSLATTGKVYADGYFTLGTSGCVKDGMLESHGKTGVTSDAKRTGSGSIVVYDDFVSAEDKQPMTVNVCYQFCRQVQDMHYFGLQNGSTCYCTPYYTAEAGSDGMCDAQCDGNAAEMCGGSNKSQLFALHDCSAHGGFSTQVSEMKTERAEVNKNFEPKGLSEDAKSVLDNLTKNANEMQAQFGKNGIKAEHFRFMEDQAKKLNAVYTPAQKVYAEKPSEIQPIVAVEGDAWLAESEAYVAAATDAVNALNSTYVTMSKPFSESSYGAWNYDKDGAFSAGKGFQQAVSKLDLADNINVDRSASRDSLYFSSVRDGAMLATHDIDNVNNVLGVVENQCAFVCGKYTECVGFNTFFNKGTNSCVFFSAVTSLEWFAGKKTLGCQGSFGEGVKKEDEGKGFTRSPRCFVKESRTRGFLVTNGKQEKVTTHERCYEA